MTKPENKNKRARNDPFEFRLEPPEEEGKQQDPPEPRPKPPDPKPSLQTIGLTECSVCRTEVSVVLTRSGHPFTACGKCGARTFFNSHIAIEILKRNMRELDHD
jgi:hypothetical protein